MSCHFPISILGQVVVDCIDSLSLDPYLLCYVNVESRQISRKYKLYCHAIFQSNFTQ